MRVISFFIFLFLSVGVCRSEAAKRKLVSVTVGKVGDRVVTSREVTMNRLIEAAMFKKGPIGPAQLKSINAKSRKDAVAGVLMEWVVFLEAKRFRSVSINEKEVLLAERKVISKLGRVAQWKALQVDRKELRQLIQRKLRSKEFIRFRIDSSYIPITDDDARNYFEANRVQFGELPFKSFKKNIRAFLKKQQVERRLKDWFDVLQRKYKVNSYSLDS